jgi:predicted Rossmann fold nucleotide-binding protein DprA/Smf involved in DNA uptake
VLQAGQPSGAYITAKMALDQGRDVAVLRHPPHDVRAAGSRELAQDGAREFGDIEEFVQSIEVVGR